MSLYIEYESPVSNGGIVMCRVKVFSNVGQSPMSNGKKVMCKVKVFQM